MWLASWLRTLAFNAMFIGGVGMIIAFVIQLAPAFILLPGAALAVCGARGLRHTAFTG